MALKIIIADDHPLLVDGLRRVLEEMDDVQVLEPVGNGRQLLARLTGQAVDIVLLDLHMPQLDGLETLRLLQKEFPSLKILVFTNYAQPKLWREVRALGARGYLLKNCTAQTLKEAVLTVSDGGTWFDEEGIAGAAPESEDTVFTDDFMKKYQITPREVEIIRKIAQGYTTKEIGEQLYVSEFTVNAHRRNICRKLDIYTPVGLVNFAKDNGLV
ncbi:MAG TPA: response regulator transcription factor [Puia sp.]|nr:response regulator transcription factor [Puia sp.]